MSTTSEPVAIPDSALAVLESSTWELEQAVGLPAEFYTSEWAHQLDQEVIFRREWLCVGRESQIPRSGDYLALTIGEEPILVVRGRDGVIRALSAVCRHRAMTLSEESGHCEKLFVCPYHSWSWDYEGTLKGVPGMANRELDREELALPRFHVETWHGFIFVNFGEDPEPLGPHLAPLDGLAERYRLSEMVLLEGREADIPGNWKTMAENNSECYHCSHLHRDTHACAPSRNVVAGTAPTGLSPVMIIRARTTHQDAAFTPTWKPYLPVIETLSEEDRNHFVWLTVHPSFVVGMYHDHLNFWMAFPNGPESVHIRTGRLYPASTLELPDFEQLNALSFDFATRLWDEDVDAITRVQAGRRSHYVNRGPFAELDEGVVAFHRWVSERYKSAGVRS